MKAFVNWVRFLWRTRNCTHPEVRRIYGDERMHYGYACRCRVCGKPLRAVPEGATQR